MKRETVVHCISVILLGVVYILWLFFTPNIRPVWWSITQMTAWSMWVEILYLIVSCFIDMNFHIKFRHNMVIFRDRLFAIESALATGVTFFFLFIILPFTPHLTSIHRSCIGHHSCTSTKSFIFLYLVNTLPTAVMIIELFTCRHNFAYRNSYIELGILTVIIMVYLMWSILCSIIYDHWPYYVQDKIAETTWLSLILHISIVFVVMLFYFIFRFISNRFWSPKASHYTQQLIQEWAYADFNRLSESKNTTELDEVNVGQEISEFEVNIFMKEDDLVDSY